MNSFREISPYDLVGNPIGKIGRDWMLVSAADGTVGEHFGKDYNTMTASWGGVGVLWNRPVAFVFVRPERNTYLFTENSEYMTLSFFGGERRDTLAFCGKTSGRDTDKVTECSLTPHFERVAEGERCVYFDEASEVLVLRKLYADTLNTDAFVDKSPLDFYRTDGVHKMYVCEIVKALVK